VKERKIVICEKDTKTGLGVLGQHESGGFQIEGLEQRMVSCFCVNPVESSAESGIVAVLFVLG
jgi:hypothetical protein